MKTNNARNERLPILRGVLVELLPWRDDPDRPGQQRRYAQLAVHCPWCDRVHLHGWNPKHDGRHVESRYPHCPHGPFLESGYLVSVLRKKDPGYCCHVVRPGRAIVRTTPERSGKPDG